MKRGAPISRRLLASTGVLATTIAVVALVPITAQQEAVPHERTGQGVQEAPYRYADPKALGLDPDTLSSLGTLVAQWVQEGRIVGAEIGAIKDRRVVLHEAIGWSDKERRLPMRRNSIFRVRSMTKPFTATAVLMLAEAGQLDLDDPVSRYLPSFRNELSGSITLRQVLTHTGGFGYDDFPRRRDTYGSLREAVDEVGEMGPAYPSGPYRYSDVGYAIAGAVVEEVSGVPVEQFIETRILEPVEMNDTHTRFTPEAPWADRVNSTYRRRSSEGAKWRKFWDNLREQRYRFFRASGGLYSTVMDYAKFMAAWMDGGLAGRARILSEASVKEALTRGSEGEYGGVHWALPKPNDERLPGLFWFGHGGSDGTYAIAVPEHDLMVFYFTQSRGNDTRGDFLRRAFQALLP